MDPFGKATLRAMAPKVPISREHSAEEWEQKRGECIQLYIKEDRTLQEVKSIMETQSSFFATSVNTVSLIANHLDGTFTNKSTGNANTSSDSEMESQKERQGRRHEGDSSKADEKKA